MEDPDLELGLHPYGETAYRVDFRLSLPGTDADIRAASSGRPIIVSIDFDCLAQAAFDPSTYGRKFTDMFFADPTLRVALAKARSRAAGEKQKLRLRIFIGPDVPRLHALRWETLLDPETGAPLATDENLLFSRYIASLDEQPVRLRQKGSLSGLVVVASPQGAPPIAYRDEIERARQGLAGIPITSLPDLSQGDGAAARPTLENLLAALRSSPCPDILYLVCHGQVVNGQPYALLEDARGQVDRVSGEHLAERLRALQQRPRLVVLLSCQSAGSGRSSSSDGSSEALSALGPRLADVGVPAVLAMQSDFSTEAAGLFLPVFFRELQNDGQIDRAMAAARAALSRRADAWVPVLLMRLQSGRLWYRPGFRDKNTATQKFPALKTNIEKRKLTPILGPGLVEPVLGTLREISRRWAAEYSYPMRPHERESLPQVAQFLAVKQQRIYPFNDLEKSLKTHLLSTTLAHAPNRRAPAFENASLNQLIEWAVLGEEPPSASEPHQVLARLDLPIYITANQDHLLEAALRRAGKTPRTILCPWNENIEQPEGIDLESIELFEPDAQAPLVYHLFGSWDQSDSVVLTEDDFFLFLMRMAGGKDVIPNLMNQALNNSSLLFLGFQLEEWSFRVILHSLLSQPGKNRRKNFVQIAAQIEPEDERTLNPALARQFLEQYMARGADLEIYWGSPKEFIGELVEYLTVAEQAA